MNDDLTVLVVAEGLRVTQELNLALRRYASATVLGPAFDEKAAREALGQVAVDVAVVDLERSDSLGPAMIERLRTSLPVLGTSSNADATVASVVLAAGGSGLLPSDAEPRQIVAILRSAAAGEIALADDHLSSVVEYLHTTRVEQQRAGVSTLTSREREVLTLLSDGRTIGEMATELGVSASTVQAHIKAIFTKLGVHSQMEAIRAAWRCGIAVPASA